MTRADCHCGAIRLLCSEAPAEITSCNCSICRRYGVLWAYFSPVHVRFEAEGPTDIYLWDDRSIEFHRCRTCGNVTHWSAGDKTIDRMGVNARLMDPAVVEQARMRFLDGAGTEEYVED